MTWEFDGNHPWTACEAKEPTRQSLLNRLRSPQKLAGKGRLRRPTWCSETSCFSINAWYLSKIWNSSLESCLLHSPSLAHSVNVSTKNRIARVVTPPESPSSRKRAWLQWGVVSSPARIQRDLLHWPCLGLAADRGRKFMSFPNKSCRYARLCKAKYWAWAYTNAQVSVAKKTGKICRSPLSYCFEETLHTGCALHNFCLCQEHVQPRPFRSKADPLCHLQETCQHQRSSALILPRCPGDVVSQRCSALRHRMIPLSHDSRFGVSECSLRFIAVYHGLVKPFSFPGRFPRSGGASSQPSGNQVCCGGSRSRASSAACRKDLGRPWDFTMLRWCPGNPSLDA